MGKPQGKVKIEWSSNFAYALGLLASDGCLSTDGRHFDFTSKDLEQIHNFKNCLGIDVKIGSKTSGYSGKYPGVRYHRVQFGDVLFYRYLLGIGFSPAKTKVIAELDIPDEYFFDFLRGHFDGDGHFYSYWDKRWKSSFMFYTGFSALSMPHIIWLRRRIKTLAGVEGHINKAYGKVANQLKYAKADSRVLLRNMYYNKSVICLSRKRLKIEKALGIVGESL